MSHVTKQLSRFLADTYVLYIKTLNFHWNMRGAQFFMYHKLLQEQYEALAEGGDEIAERIRQLGERAPASMEEFLKLTSLKEALSPLPMLEMIKELVVAHKSMVGHAGEIIAYCDAHSDPGTSDMIVGFMRFHDKQAWLLESHLSDS